jgi:hypothetical protein
MGEVISFGIGAPALQGDAPQCDDGMTLLDALVDPIGLPPETTDALVAHLRENPSFSMQRRPPAACRT